MFDLWERRRTPELPTFQLIQDLTKKTGRPLTALKTNVRGLNDEDMLQEKEKCQVSVNAKFSKTVHC